MLVLPARTALRALLRVLLALDMLHCGLVTAASASSSTATTYPSLIECVCNTTLASAAVVTTSTSAATSGQAQKYVLPSCLDDVFAETGVRWYVDGPLLPGVTYWRQAQPSVYSSGRAAQRLIALGYRCSRLQLYDAADPYY